MLTALLRKWCGSDNTHDKAHHSRRLRFLPSFSNLLDLQEEVRFVNTGNDCPYKCIDQVPENERTDEQHRYMG